MTDETKTTAEMVQGAIEELSPASPTEETAKRRKTAEPQKRQYLVINGAIAPNGGGRSDLVHPGTVVSLTVEQAKHYNKLGYLKPYIED